MYYHNRSLPPRIFSINISFKYSPSIDPRLPKFLVVSPHQAAIFLYSKTSVSHSETCSMMWNFTRMSITFPKKQTYSVSNVNGPISTLVAPAMPALPHSRAQVYRKQLHLKIEPVKIHKRGPKSPSAAKIQPSALSLHPDAG